MSKIRRISCATTAAVFVTALVSSAARAQSSSLEKIARDYRIEVVTTEPRFPVKTRYGMIEGKRADSKALETYTRLFAFEFTLYPPNLVKRAQLKQVVLCTELSFAGQRRNAIPDYEHDTLYLDVSRGSYSKPYLRTVVHHEFFHIVDYRDDGSVYRDDRWAGLNPAKFKYGSGGKKAQDIATTSVLTDKYPGFLNHYSTTAVEEDKAEVFAHLMVSSAYVAKRAKNDRVLKAKIERMHELLASFCPDMNEEFWEKVRKVERNDE